MLHGRNQLPAGVLGQEKEKYHNQTGGYHLPFGVLGHIPRNINNGVLGRQELVQVGHSSDQFFTQNPFMLSFLSFLYQKANVLEF